LGYVGIHTIPVNGTSTCYCDRNADGIVNSLSEHQRISVNGDSPHTSIVTLMFVTDVEKNGTRNRYQIKGTIHIHRWIRWMCIVLQHSRPVLWATETDMGL